MNKMMDKLKAIFIRLRGALFCNSDYLDWYCRRKAKR